MAASLFIAAAVPAVIASLASVTAIVVSTMVGVAATLLLSRLLSKTWLAGEPSAFQLELPPYRRPKVLRVLNRSLIDRTIFVLGRAMAVAAPAGGVIWLLANVDLGGVSLFAHIAAALDPVGHFIGLDGVLLLAVIVAILANEIVIPTVLMGYLAVGQMTEISDSSALRSLLETNGWTMTTAICLLLFMVLRNPCSTTTWTIWKETRSLVWMVASNLIPLALAITINASVAQVARLL